MNILSKKERIQIETLRDCCRTFIWINKIDRANACLFLARLIYKRAHKRENTITKTLVA